MSAIEGVGLGGGVTVEVGGAGTGVSVGVGNRVGVSVTVGVGIIHHRLTSVSVAQSTSPPPAIPPNRPPIRKALANSSTSMQPEYQCLAFPGASPLLTVPETLFTARTYSYALTSISSPLITSPTTQACCLCVVHSARKLSTRSAGTAINIPPDVCASHRSICRSSEIPSSN